MTHIPGMPISYDEPSEWKDSCSGCPKCRRLTVKFRTHDSSCGGYEDQQCKCTACGYSWWVDGPDA